MHMGKPMKLKKSDIEKWLATNQTSPITRNPLTITDLKENITVKL